MSGALTRSGGHSYLHFGSLFQLIYYVTQRLPALSVMGAKFRLLHRHMPLGPCEVTDPRVGGVSVVGRDAMGGFWQALIRRITKWTQVSGARLCQWIAPGLNVVLVEKEHLIIGRQLTMWPEFPIIVTCRCVEAVCYHRLGRFMFWYLFPVKGLF